jgi:hypothetical protein
MYVIVCILCMCSYQGDVLMRFTGVRPVFQLLIEACRRSWRHHSLFGIIGTAAETSVTLPIVADSGESLLHRFWTWHLLSINAHVHINNTRVLFLPQALILLSVHVAVK